MVDFIEEVEDQLRADRYRTLARTYLPWFVAALAALVVGWLGVWAYQTWQAGLVGKASTVYDKGLTALTQNDMTGAFADFETVGKTGPAGYRTLALMQQGNIRLIAGKTDEAVTFYDTAAKASPNATLGDLARLKAALALLDTAPYAQVSTRLSALIGDKKPYDLQAREALAMAKLAAGKTAEARAAYSNLTITLGVSQEMRQRALEAMALIDNGEARTVVAAAAAAATLPPPSAASMGPAQAGPPPGAQEDPQAAADPRNAQ